MSNKEQFLKILENCPEEIWNKFYFGFGLDDWSEAVADFPEAHPILLEKLANGIEYWLKDCYVFKDCAEKERQNIIDAYDVFMYDNEKKPISEYKINGNDGMDLAKRIREVKLKKLLS